MKLMKTHIVVNAIKEFDAFRSRIMGIPYERKGVLYSEAFLLYLCTLIAPPQRIQESGRARGQSTLLLSSLFPDRPVISVEFDARSPDTEVARLRLSGRTNVDVRFGDATQRLSTRRSITDGCSRVLSLPA
ncbi:MAG: hypothetical protein ACJ8KO_11970 [Sulfurifustaceae bacterium]